VRRAGGARLWTGKVDEGVTARYARYAWHACMVHSAVMAVLFRHPPAALSGICIYSTCICSICFCRICMFFVSGSQAFLTCALRSPEGAYDIKHIVIHL